MSKRQRSSSNGSAQYHHKRPHASIPRVIPGYTRTAGAYARSHSSYEKKYLDTSTATTAFAAAGTIVSTLNAIPQGATDQERIGNKCQLRNINSTMLIAIPSQVTAAAGDAIFRAIYYIDYQANGAAAAVTDILKTAAWNSHRNMNQVDRFKILSDKTWVFMPLRGPGADASVDYFAVKKFSWKGNLPLFFSGATGAITELKSNNIGVLLISNSTTIPTHQLQVRVKFTET